MTVGRDASMSNSERSDLPVGIPTLQDEDAARRAIHRNRLLATGLLAAMVAIFASTWIVPHPGFAVALLRAGSEAGIVGGLADWFAVTALFRHPLGLPIPHTAILPKNKDRIGRALAAFIERSFLTEAVLLPRLRAARPARLLADWLSSPHAAPLIIAPVLASLPHVLRVVENRQMRDFFHQAVGDRLRNVDVAPLLGRALDVLTHSGEADVLFERVVDVALRWLQDNKGEVDKLVAQRSRWWVPYAIDRRIARTIADSIVEVLQGLRRPDGGTREKFRAALAELIEELKHSPERRAELNAARDRLLEHPEVQAWLSAVWTELSEALQRDAATPESRIGVMLERALLSLGHALAADPAIQERIEQTLEGIVRWVISFRGEIAHFMAEVIRSWDAQTLSARLELVIGSDLQYIRMNGTVVGALVGCALFLITRLAP